MRTTTITATSQAEAAQICLAEHDWYPDAIREVDSGDGTRAWKCFESAEDARVWDQQL